LNDVLERGEYVVQVEISRDAADDVDDDEKRSVGTALVDAGATEVAFYDTLAVEDLEIRS
ncbi:MAG: hypothetical protein WD670_07555, partial [Actinomycetota bacterium]